MVAFFMRLGLYTAALSGMGIEETFDRCTSLGIETVELTTVGYPHKAHINIDELLSGKAALDKLVELLKRKNLSISALGCSGNHVHPQKEVREPFQELFKRTILLAEALGIERIVTFSGCPGDCDASLYPNWVTCPWPDDYVKVLDYQWNDVLLPYWRSAAKFAADHGVTKICLEMHPGFCVYNTETFLKLRSALGAIPGVSIGLNLDPSHLFWQGIDPVEVIAGVGESIFHFHAKDTFVDRKNVRLNGVLDAKHYGKAADRAWTFRTVGYGHPAQTWRDIISALRIAGYDYVLSIEHEDCLMSRDEGLQKAVGFLRELMIGEAAAEMWWA
jgi:sugar phosphate isomerase/epimerase